MLYDPKWEVQTKADPLSLGALIAWLEKQPANVEYCYIDNGHCLLAQYFTFCGFENVMVGGLGEWSCGPDRNFHKHESRQSPPGFYGVAAEKPHTFGAALKRARAAAARR